MENNNNLLECVLYKMSESIESFKNVVAILQDTQKLMAEVNDKLDKINDGFDNYEIDMGRKFRCENCHEVYDMDCHGTSELALQDDICEFCMRDGYGA